MKNSTPGFGTAPVFFTAISTILGAILFLRFGYAVGTLGFLGTLLIILLGHLVTIPTSLAISELATNQKVEGGGEYFIISRSFGLNIGATIGIALYLSQAISVAFYIIAFTESFQFFFDFLKSNYNINLPRQAISIPAMGGLSFLILTKGANQGVKALYVVVGILFCSLVLFFLGKPISGEVVPFTDPLRNMDDFFVVFAIIFPAFTGMTAGVGLSGDLKNPGKSIPLGSITATLSGMIIYIFIAWKMVASASPDDLVSDQMIMGKIAIFGAVAIPIGLAASTISSAIGSVLVAPRTLQALAGDRSLLSKRVNNYLSKGKGESHEPFNASLITCMIAFVFVALGDVDVVAKIISMFFMVTYGSICMISFLYHFGADPSYRPTFKSRWFISLIGLLTCIWLMFKMNTAYALISAVLMTAIYLLISYFHKHRGGLEEIFQGAIFQITRQLQVFLQRSDKKRGPEKWRPSVVCISRDSFKRDSAFDLTTWISYQYGFGTYIHFIEGYYSHQTHMEATQLLEKLIEQTAHKKTKVYIDTLISPSYTSAIAQVIQLPSISGKENNMFVFEYSKENPTNLNQIIDNYPLVRAGDYDVCILASSNKKVDTHNGIHIWVTSHDYENSNLMILLSYIILGHPDWKKGFIRIFYVTGILEHENKKTDFLEMIQTGRLEISQKNVTFIEKNADNNLKQLVNEHSSDAGLTIIGFRDKMIKNLETDLFKGFDNAGNILFVNSIKRKEIS